MLALFSWMVLLGSASILDTRLHSTGVTHSIVTKLSDLGVALQATIRSFAVLLPLEFVKRAEILFQPFGDQMLTVSFAQKAHFACHLSLTRRHLAHQACQECTKRHPKCAKVQRDGTQKG